jgi:hypothetical protein
MRHEQPSAFKTHTLSPSVRMTVGSVDAITISLITPSGKADE